MDSPLVSRRRIVQLGGAFALAAAAGPMLAGPASAAPGQKKPGTVVTDLGPAVEQFSLMSSLMMGDTMFIGSRNLDPPRVLGYHVPSRKVVSRTDLSAGYTIQAMAADPGGRYLYIGTLSKSMAEPANLFRWDVTTPSVPAVALGRIGDRDVRDLAVAPDGRVYAVGGGATTPPALWEYNPATGAISSLGIPDPKATLARAVAATATTVFFGAGSVLGGGGSASKTSLFAYDRAQGTFTSIAPAETSGDPSLRELAIVGDKLAIGTSGSKDPAHFAIMDLADYSSYTVLPSNGVTVKTFAAVGEKIYYSTDKGLQVYSTTANTISDVDLKGQDLGEIWGVDGHQGRLQVSSAYGFIADINPADGTSTTTDLGTAGAPVDPQLVMGIAAGAGRVYVGGTGTVVERLLRTGKKTYLQLPGEAKDALVLKGTLYTGQYNSQGIWGYDPRDGQGPRRLAAFPAGQNRPLDVEWDEKHGLILVGVQDDADGGGSLTTYSPKTGKATSAVNPIDGVQLVRAVACEDGVAYLGGDNAQAAGPRGTIVAWDPVAGRELWRVESGQAKGVASLAVKGRYLFGLSLGGGYFVVDLRSRAVVHTEDLRGICPGFSAMVVNRGFVYAASDTTVFRFDPKTFEVETVVAEINGGWYSGPHIANDEDGMLYSMRGRNLVAIDDHPRR
ncbi:outer membrane protein assembly factor BamB family protein [Arthrobacter sp. 35W]|uniref:outer membrane protein assembly factor BamB family protein n=1 Tax=Arthrobacter sp. 35W TaxID=1132441 RepID=UPI00041659F4|nr:PQQ-binding-like beta-propeller repeat protein [Arthrobacter sp. 35W]